MCVKHALGAALVGRAASCLKRSLRRGLCVPCRVLLRIRCLKQKLALTNQEEPLLSTRGEEAVAAEAQFAFDMLTRLLAPGS